MPGSSPTVALAAELIARQSVTPADAGCQQLIGERLARAGFALEPMPFGDVSNLYARRGSAAPLLCFAGHTDVVPSGPADQWRSPPFEPTVRDGRLYGRGAADMKGGIAAMVTAVERFVSAHPRHAGSLALLLTSDEEGPAVDGTRRVMETLAARSEPIDYCVVGEPSSAQRVGDTVRIGRRGSLHGRLTVHGLQGHVAYPDKADNPIHRLAPALTELCAVEWDGGDADFPATTLQFSNLVAGTGADNVVPGTLEALFNFRYSTAVTPAELAERAAAILDRHGLRYAVDWRLAAEPFLTRGGALVQAVGESIRDVAGREAELSTAGGTSDGRFIAPHGVEVVELGLVNSSIHQIDEWTSLADLDTLSTLYEAIMVRLLGGA